MSLSPRKVDVSIFAGLQQFLRYLKEEKQASVYTLEAYERDLLRFAALREARGQSMVLTDVTSEELRSHMHSLIDRHLAKATVRRAMYALGSFFGWAQRWDLVPSNPVARITVPRRERVREIRALSKRERAILVAAADQVAASSSRHLNQQAPLLVRLMLKEGLRRSEALGLIWRDIELEKRELFVRYGKGGKSRCLPIEDEQLLDLLRRTRDARLMDGEPGMDMPVVSNNRGRFLTHGSFYRLFHRVLERAKLAGCGITPHALRHTFGSVLCARGVPVPYIKDLLGHADIGSTMVYMHSTPAALRQAVRKFRE